MNALAILLLQTALAEPPGRPVAPEPLEGECPGTVGFTHGNAVPGGIVGGDGLVLCSGVLSPLSDYQDLLQTEAWAEALDSRYRLDTAHLVLERDWYQQQLELIQQPLPLLERPAVILTMGITSGVAVVLLSAYAFDTVADGGTP
jgi:hypothetical protein